ncbi:MAG TPA: protein kinase [Bacteroidota bacterium]|nr:protein kinase [Bacteroidota bacterium]
MIGKTISHYTVLEKLGEGGMGVVYKAEDTKLKRMVSLKFLPAHLAASEQEKTRFMQEAQAAAALNHPNICSIIDILEHNGQMFIVMEFIDGENIKNVCGKLPEQTAIACGIQIGRALTHAHRRGIVHRDLKTDNIMLTPEGEIKIMDFGLAKIEGRERFTKVGTVLGTAAYMSPEQTRGEETDHRTDLFSFGVVLFELFSGRLPFRGDHAVAISYSIVNEAPASLRSLVPHLSPVLEDIVQRCLEKDPTKRFQSAEEIVSQLRNIERGSREPSAVGPRHTEIALRQVTFAETVEEYPAWSPDSRRLVFSREMNGFKKLFVKDLTGGTETQLTSGFGDDIQSVWSPDARRILFVRSRRTDGKMEPRDLYSSYDDGDVWGIDLEAGKETKLIENAFNPAYSPNGAWIAVDASWAGPRRIWLVDSRGRNPRQVTSDVSEAILHLAPKWSPDGVKIIFQNVERVKFDIRIVNVNSGKIDWLTDDTIQDLYPVWSPSGAEILLSSFRSGGVNLWSIPIADNGSVGRARQLTMGAGQDIQAAVSPDGKRLVYATLRLNADIWRLPVLPETGMPTGAPQPLITGTREESRGAWSPDGTMIALNSDRSGEMNLWLYVLADGSMQQLTHGAGGDFQPNWSPDARWLSFFSGRSGRPEIWRVEIATGALTQLTKNSSLKINPFISPDGQRIAYHCDEAGRLEPWIMNADGSDQQRLAEMEVSGHFMRWSKDGKSVIVRSPNPSRPGLWSLPLRGEEPKFICVPKGGAHISLSSDHDLVMDVVDHKELWVTPVNGNPPKPVFKFDDPQVRIDYPVWSPDGAWLLFDRVRPQGGNIWLMEHRE